MDCKLCERELEAYLKDRLSPGQRSQVEIHLNECESCSQSLFLEKIALEVIQAKKKISPDPSLADKVMGFINDDSATTDDDKVVFMFPSILRKVAYTISVAAAVYIGIVAGNFYLAEDSVPAEMSYINDAQIEAVNLFINEN